MLFNSFEYFLFFPIVVMLYFGVPQRFRWVLLLAASYFFYMCWKPGYLLLIVASTLVDYWAGLGIGRATSISSKRGYLAASLTANLGLLFFFKYYNFFSDSLREFSGLWGGTLDIPHSDFLLPVGISFYTFQTLSYTIEVYRGNKEPERHLGIFALYVAFFPQLVAGPIERAQRLLPQFREKHEFVYDRVVSGLKLIVWGLFKKVVIADRLAGVVDVVYGNVDAYSGPAFVVATVAFAFQIFCDFSGYTDIAIGSARVMGFELMTNFRRPYFAASIPDFWRRWHISLSTWFRDYVYVPLGGSRVSRSRWYGNLFIVFLVSGLWHGANWTFVIWGALHGVYMILSDWLKPAREWATAASGLTRFPRILRVLQTGVTFALVCFSWIFFRARSVSDAWHIARGIFFGWSDVLSASGVVHLVYALRLNLREAAIMAACVGTLVLAHLVQSRGSVGEWIARQPVGLRWVSYSLLLWAIFLFGVFKSQEFIYFTF